MKFILSFYVGIFCVGTLLSETPPHSPVHISFLEEHSDVFVVTKAGSQLIYDTRSKQLLCKAPGIRTLHFSPSKQTLISYDYASSRNLEGKLYVWNCSTSRAIAELDLPPWKTSATGSAFVDSKVTRIIYTLTNIPTETSPLSMNISVHDVSTGRPLFKAAGQGIVEAQLDESERYLFFREVNRVSPYTSTSRVVRLSDGAEAKMSKPEMLNGLLLKNGDFVFFLKDQMSVVPVDTLNFPLRTSHNNK